MPRLPILADRSRCTTLDRTLGILIWMSTDGAEAMKVTQRRQDKSDLNFWDLTVLLDPTDEAPLPGEEASFGDLGPCYVLSSRKVDALTVPKGMAGDIALRLRVHPTETGPEVGDF